jgi:hypothetical protein
VSRSTLYQASTAGGADALLEDTRHHPVRTQYGADLQILTYVSVPKSYGLKSPLFPSEEKNN